MSQTIPRAFHDLFEKRTFAHLATLRPDGSPHSTPVWCDRQGERVRVNTARGRAKEKDVERDARVALSILDPENPYRHLAIRGRVVEVTEAGAEEHIDALAKKYLNLDRYPNRQPGERRVILEIEPEVVSTMG